MLNSQSTIADNNLVNTYDVIDPTKNDAPLDFNKHSKKIAIVDLDGTTSGVSSSADLLDKGSTNKDKDCSFSSANQRRPSFERHRDFRKNQECQSLSCKETTDINILRNSSGPFDRILSNPTFINPNSLAQSATNPGAIGTSIIHAVGVEPAQWSLGSSTSLNPAPFAQSSATLGPAFAAMGVGDQSLLGVMGMPGFGQFGFMRTVDNAVAAVLGSTGSSNIVGSATKDVIQLSNCVLYPPKANQPSPTTRDRPPGCKTVFVGGLPEKCSEDIIKEIFSPCGEISTIRMSKKNFCHIRFENESYVDSAIFLSGYRIKVGDVDDCASIGRIHVDYAQARDDQYEWECRERAIQRELRHRERMEQERLRPPSPPAIVHYSDHEASLLIEKLKSEESFQKAAQVLITWLDRGELSKKNGGQFYSMLQSTNSHIRRLTNEKTQYEDELNRAKELLKQRMQGIYLQFHQIEKVFLAASHQKVWDHFTKAQRKNIDTWRKQAEEIKNAQLEEILNEREESEMDLSDEDAPEGDSNSQPNKKQRTSDSLGDMTIRLNSTSAGNNCTSITLQLADEEISRAKEENDLLRCQLEAYRNEVEVLRSEAIQDKETSDKRMKLLQQALQGMQHQLLAVSQQKTRDDEEISQLKVKLTPGSNSMVTATSFETTSQNTEVTSNNLFEQSSIPEISSTSTNFIQVTEKEVKFIGLIAAFLNVHHFGASTDYIWSYLQHLDPSLQTRDVESLLDKFPTVFKQEVSGVGAKMERKWKFCGFS